jgi:hypothetical protein
MWTLGNAGMGALQVCMNFSLVLIQSIKTWKNVGCFISEFLYAQCLRHIWMLTQSCAALLLSKDIVRQILPYFCDIVKIGSPIEIIFLPKDGLAMCV